MINNGNLVIISNILAHNIISLKTKNTKEDYE